MHKRLHDAFQQRTWKVCMQTAQVWPHTKNLPLRAAAKKRVVICRHKRNVKSFAWL